MLSFNGGLIVASKQTERSARYQKKAGWISKSFKMKQDLSEQFKAACGAAGVSQASVITQAMKEFIEKHPVK